MSLTTMPPLIGYELQDNKIDRRNHIHCMQDNGLQKINLIRLADGNKYIVDQ